LLISYNLFGTADVPTRLQNISIPAMDNIFINYSWQGNYEIFPVHDGLSDQDAQLISIHDVDFYVQTYNIQNIRKINKHSLDGLNYNIGLEQRMIYLMK
jgi:hypothetical protein